MYAENSPIPQKLKAPTDDEKYVYHELFMEKKNNSLDRCKILEKTWLIRKRLIAHSCLEKKTNTRYHQARMTEVFVREVISDMANY